MITAMAATAIPANMAIQPLTIIISAMGMAMAVATVTIITIMAANATITIIAAMAANKDYNNKINNGNNN